MLQAILVMQFPNYAVVQHTGIKQHNTCLADIQVRQQCHAAVVLDAPSGVQEKHIGNTEVTHACNILAHYFWPVVQLCIVHNIIHHLP